eukprot:1176024-Prorocentrum_minimum.AAC.2
MGRALRALTEECSMLEQQSAIEQARATETRSETSVVPTVTVSSVWPSVNPATESLAATPVYGKWQKP